MVTERIKQGKMSVDEKIKITVLMSVYNTNTEFLRASIVSILEQSYQNFEFIIINDGCDDLETLDTLREYTELDKRIRCIDNAFNMGLTKSLNRGLSMARGMFIARMDADDIALPDRLKLQIDYMEKHPEITVLGCNAEKFGEIDQKQSMVFRDFTQGSEERFRIKMLLYNAGPVHSSVMIRKAFLDESGIRYREEIKKAQDYALWVDCLNNGGIIYNLPITLMKYRMHGGQITSEKANEQVQYARKVIEEQLFAKGFRDIEAGSIISSLCLEELVTSTKKYINSLRKLVLWNLSYKIFNEKYLEQEVKLRWLNKIIKNFIRNHSIEPFFHTFSIKCLLGSTMIRWIKIYILKIYL